MQNPTVQEFFDNYVVINYGRSLTRSAVSHAGVGAQYKAIERALVELFYPNEQRVARTRQITVDTIPIEDEGDNVFEFNSTRPILEPRSLSLHVGTPAIKEWSGDDCCCDCDDSSSSYEECEYCSCEPCNHIFREGLELIYKEPREQLEKNSYKIIGGPSTWGTGGTRIKMRLCPKDCCDISQENLYISYIRGPKPITCSSQRLFIHREYLNVLAELTAVKIGIRAQNFRAGDEVTYRDMGYSLMKSLDFRYKIRETGDIFEASENADMKLANGGSSIARHVRSILSE